MFIRAQQRICRNRIPDERDDLLAPDAPIALSRRDDFYDGAVHRDSADSLPVVVIGSPDAGLFVYGVSGGNYDKGKSFVPAGAPLEAA